MDGSRGPGALETAWSGYVSTLDPQENVVVPIHAISSVQIHQLRELRLHAYLPERGFRPLGGLYSVAETLGLSSKRQAWQLRIQDFVIEKELRGRGIGTQMLRLFLRMAEEEGFDYVSGELSSQDAIDGSVAHLIRFYERHGFKISPVRRPGGILASIRRDILKPASAAAFSKAQ
jgi:ribosomal protein S18 acetylase RimI-like enzyme